MLQNSVYKWFGAITCRTDLTVLTKDAHIFLRGILLELDVCIPGDKYYELRQAFKINIKLSRQKEKR